MKYPVATRWNSLLDSVKDLLSHKQKLPLLCQKLQVEMLSDDEITYLDEYLELLKPIAEAIDFLQKDEGMLFGYLLPTLATITTKYAKLLMKRATQRFKMIAQGLLNSVKTRFATYFQMESSAEMAIVASVLCPTVKCRWVKALDCNFDSRTEANVLKIAKDAVVAMSNEETTTPSPVEAGIADFFDFSLTGII